MIRQETRSLIGKVRYIAARDARVLDDDNTAVNLVWRYFYTHLFEPEGDNPCGKITLLNARELPGMKEVRRARLTVKRQREEAYTRSMPNKPTPWWVFAD